MVADPLEFESIFSGNVKGTANVKYKLYMMNAVYKLSTCQATRMQSFPIWHFIIDFISMVLPSSDFLLSLIFHNPFEENPQTDIYMNSPILSILTPFLASRLSFMFLSFLYLFLTDIFFIACFLWPHLVKNFRFFLNINLQYGLLFFPCSVIAYTFFDLIAYSESNTVIVFLGILNIIAFIPYVIIICISGFVTGFTVIKPNPVTSTWFLDNCYIYPLYMFINQIISFSIPRAEYKIQIALFSINIFLSIFLILFVYMQLPMIYYPTNVVHLTKIYVVAYNNILGLILICLGIKHVAWPVATIPIAVLIFLTLSNFTLQIRRNYYSKYLEGLDPIDNLTTEFLETYFTKGEKEQTFQMIIKIGLQIGSQTVINPTFVAYVIKHFPKSQFMVMYVNYLYAVIWGVDNDTYQYFLHMLSVNQLGTAAEIGLFETIYCYMQLAGNEPPIIQKEILKFQELTVQFAQQTTIFWQKISDNKEELYNQIEAVHSVYMLGAKQIQKMNILFPFSPIVAFYNSIFLADFKKNYKRASIAYSRGETLVNYGSRFVAAFLRNQQRPFLSVDVDDDNHITEVKPLFDEYKFMSVSEHSNDLATRDPNYPINDPYIQRNSSTYRASRNHLFNEAPYINNGVRPFYGVVILVFAVLIVLFVWYYIDWKQSYDDMVLNRDLQNTCYMGSIFLDRVEALIYNLRLILRVNEKNEYDEEALSHINIFSKKHLEMTTKDISTFTTLVDSHSNILNINSIPTMTSETICTLDDPGNCTYIFYYFKLMEVGTLAMRNDDITAVKLTHDELLELDTILQNVTYSYLNELNSMIKERIDYLIYDKFYMRIIKMCITIVILLIICLIIKVLFVNVKKQLFVVFSTLQKPVKKMLETQFSKFLENRDKTIGLPQIQSPIHYLVFLSLSLIMFFPHPLISLFFIITSKDTSVLNYADPQYIESHNRSINFDGYKEHLLLEYSSIGYNFDIEDHNNDTCVNYYFNRTIEEPFEENFITYELSEWTSLLLHVCLAFSFIFFIFFFRNLNAFLHKFRATRYLLFSIPTSIGRSNPVFNKIITGLPVIASEISGFVDEINKPFNNFTYFGLIKLDENDNVIKVSNNVEHLLNTIPKDKNDITQALLDAGVQQEEIDSFFSERSEKNILSGSFPQDNIDFLIYFTNDSTIFIKNETNNKDINRKAKRANLFEYKMKFFSRKNVDSIEDSCLIMINNIEKQDLIKVHTLSADYDQIYFEDSRYKKLTYAAELATEDKISVLQQIITFTLQALSIAHSSDAIIGYGGKLKINAPNKKMLERSRFVGDSYTKTLFFSRQATRKSRFYVQKEIIDMFDERSFEKLFHKTKSSIRLTQFKTTTFQTEYYIIF